MPETFSRNFKKLDYFFGECGRLSNARIFLTSRRCQRHASDDIKRLINILQQSGSLLGFAECVISSDKTRGKRRMMMIPGDEVIFSQVAFQAKKISGGRA